jgi:signal transduction histidine kinase
MKHSSAANVSISLSHVPGGLELKIADDGRGFDQQTVKRGLGLNGIEERARMIGADLTIVSAPGQGSSLKPAAI